ncbi:MAG TPA: PSD1 and planctomycete cytochrome C domain-containing protein, partial [Pirellulaceae bacterium]|nr:PSD1 and planctomycete cytochrome C domain-containing protein [Pirellulaceae bacterium]
MFERKVRPLLARRCHECHGAEKHKGELRLTSRAALLQGGESGPAIDLAQPESSLLLKAVRYDGLEMPPTAKLPAAEIAILTDWIKQGAPWPADPNDSSAAPTPDPRRTSQSDAITDADREHWSFRPVVRPAVPTLAALPAAGSPSPGSASPGSHNADSRAPTQPLDLFIEAALRKKGLVANGRAPVDVLVRRVFFALTGLPPTHDELVEWCDRIGGRQETGGGGVGESGGKSAIADDRFDRAAYAQLVDQLLARPAYGEHWARHWLDIVRFAQSNGYERDGYKPHAWRYRDYVVQAFAQDKPYDRFILEQLAGDELPDADGTSRMATGFYRLGVWDDEPDDARQAEFDGLDDVMVTIGASFMGLTIGCARCHEHKFDPIPQADYYRLLAFIRNVRPYANPEATATNATTLPTNDDATIRSRFAAWQARVREREQAVASAANDAERKKLTAQPVDARIDGLDWALAVRESNTAPPATHVLIRGNAGTPGPTVEPGFPLVLSDPRRDAAAKSEFRSESPLSDLFPSSGRRLALARWLASPDNPLTARVMVNRVWHAHFGRGIVATTADFGAAGEPPTHPELLDWLADDLVRSGWSIKHLQRTILLSETFCRSSTIAPGSAAHQAALKSDPGSRLLWSFPLRRLAAESIRDRMLVASGELNRAVGGVEMYPRLSGEVLAG